MTVRLTLKLKILYIPSSHPPTFFNGTFLRHGSSNSIFQAIEVFEFISRLSNMAR